MKRYWPVISVSLLVSLLIYLFFRTEKTVINQCFIAVFSRETYHTLKHYVQTNFPLPASCIYSLPEGLWVFCITITSRFYVFTFNGKKLNLIFLPVFLVFAWEICQAYAITNGRFDFIDIGFSLLFWALAYMFTKPVTKELKTPTQLNLDVYSCGFCYCIVYLSHVG